MKSFQKQPADHLDYTVDLRRWLPEGDTITAVDTNVPAGLIETSLDIYDRETRVWIQGGTDGEVYKVEITVTTAQGRVKEVEFLIVVVET